jgi:asparaginyl-tRNA synthetase
MRCTLVRQAVKSIAEHLSSSSSSSSTASELISIHAWIRTIRRQKTLSFVSLNDGSSHQGIQAVIPSSILDQHEEKVKSALTSGASVVFRGKLQDKKAGKGVQQGAKELQVESFDVLGECDGKYLV